MNSDIRLVNPRGDARRFLLSKLVVDHHLAARDPFAAKAGADEGAIADMLLGDAPVTKTRIAALATNSSAAMSAMALAYTPSSRATAGERRSDVLPAC